MHVEEVMSADMLTIASEETLRAAAQKMSERNTGAAIVIDNTNVGAPPGIITERDVLRSVAAGEDPDRQRVADNSTPEAVTVPVDASVEQAVQRMMDGDFRHLLVVQGDAAAGIISMRDLVDALRSG